MEIKYGKQVEIDALKNASFDFLLFASNHEDRVRTAFDNLSKFASIAKTIVLFYPNSTTHIEDIEGRTIREHTDIYKLLDELILQINKKEITIAIDYSCMTKSWYYSIILYLAKKKLPLNRVTCYFIYTPSSYSDPIDPKPNKDIAPLPGKYIVPTDKPKALIVCLGYEQNKAEGIIDHLDPKVSYLFYTKPASDPQFVEVLEKNNQNILKEKSFNVITYPFDDLLFLERQLSALYFKLKDNYSIIIAPIGPKPFTFTAMLMSIKYPEIDIWRVGSGSDINIYSRAPIRDIKFIISEIVFE